MEHERDQAKRIRMILLAGMLLLALAFGGESLQRAKSAGVSHSGRASSTKGLPELSRDQEIVENIHPRWRSRLLESWDRGHETNLEIGTAQTSLLQGTYAYSATGARYDTLLRTTDIQSAIGEFTFDGQGRFTGFQISRTLFTGTQSFSFAGTYTLDASGAGFLFYTSGQVHSLLVVQGGEAFFFVDIRSSNFREAGYARRL